ncbi:hypothetical protein F5Y10DRAFT_255308 [Nemania abortiva]|nr:hypothetical protein F5Y10DRAFT_255308 [Nemania abortiva]
MTEQDKHEVGSRAANKVQESSSFPCLATDGCWFGRANVRDVADVDLTASLAGGPWPHSCLNSSSSSGSLVCPRTVLIPPLGEVSGNVHFGNANNVPSDETYAQEADQAPRQWCEYTNDLESLASVPQIAGDQMLYANQNTRPSDLDNSLRYDVHNSIRLSSADLMINQAIRPNITDLDFLVACGLSQVQPTDLTSQGNLSSSILRSDGVADIANYADIERLKTSVFQSRNNRGTTPGPSSSYQWPSPATSGFERLPLSLHDRPLDGEIMRSGSFVEGLVNKSLSRSGGNEIDASLHSTGARMGSKAKSKQQKTKVTKVVKVFACNYNGCPFTARSRKDVRRHMRSDKHREDNLDGSPPRERFYCDVAGCKFANEGFSRRDNMIRHMSSMHDVEIDREKPGRKRAGDE